MKFLLLLSLYLIMSSCSLLSSNARFPAEVQAPTCHELAKNIFMTDNYKEDLLKALEDKKLIKFRQKIIQVQYPKLEWINKVKIRFNQSLRNWNNNQYPAFYLFNNEEIIPIAKKYAENIEKIAADQVPINDTDSTTAFLNVSDWIESFENYKKEMDQLTEERIVLQYNYNLLKKLKLTDNGPRDILITTKKDGVLRDDVITLRKEDKNLEFTLAKLKKQMSELDGTLLSNGKIKERIIRQAMLKDMLTILHREVEFKIKNSATNSSEALKELEKLSQLIHSPDFNPSTYGVYKIQDKIFIRELLNSTKLDKVYPFIEAPLLKIKTIISDYFKNRNAGSDTQKIGVLKRLYAKIANISPKQASIGGGTVIIAGIGLERYFTFKENGTVTETSLEPAGDVKEVDQAHEVQLEQTVRVEEEKHASQSHVIEAEINDLIK